MKKGQKAVTTAPENHTCLTKGKERRKRKSEEEERRRRGKSNGYILSFYNGYFVDSFWPKKNCLTDEVHLAVTFTKIRLDISSLFF